MSKATPIFPNLEHTAAEATPCAAATSQRCLGYRLAGFFRQLRERKVCRAAAAYAILSWIILQLGEIVFPSLGLPAWTLTLVVVVAIAGFPIAMILAWVLQWTDNGLVIDVPQNEGQAQSSKLDTVLNFVLLVSAIVLSMQLVWNHSDAQATTTTTTTTTQESTAAIDPTIAIIPLTGENLAASTDAQTIEQLLRYELVSTQHHPLQLIAGVSSAEAFAAAGNTVPLNWIVEGSVQNTDGQIRLLLHLVELPGRRYVDSWSLNADPTSPNAHQELATTAVATLVGYLNGVYNIDTP